MNATSPVSVIIPIRNPHPDHFLQTLRSLTVQTHGEFEVVIVETPGRHAAAPFLDAIQDRRFRLIRWDGPPSIAAARRCGLAASAHPLVALLDGDDIAHPERLAKQVDHFAEKPELSVLGSAIEFIDEHGRVLGWRPFPLSHNDIRATLPLYNCIAQPSVMFRKQHVLEAGNYGDSICEDYELWSRMVRSGFHFANLPDRLVQYRLHSGSTKTNKMRSSLRDTIRIKRLHWGGELDFTARKRILLERMLLLLPAPLVMKLFRHWVIRAIPPEGTRCGS